MAHSDAPDVSIGGLHQQIIIQLRSHVRTFGTHDELRSDELLILLERGAELIPTGDLVWLIHQLEHVRLVAHRAKTKNRLSAIIDKLQRRHDDAVR